MVSCDSGASFQRLIGMSSRLEVLRALVGHIPPHPLWAELLWQRQDELAKRVQSAASLSQTQAIPRALSPAGRHYHR